MIRRLLVHTHPHSGFVALLVGALTMLGVMSVVFTSAAATPFKIRGIVRDVDVTHKVLTLQVTHIEKGWPAVRYEKSPYTVRLSNRGTRFWRYNAEGKRVRFDVTSVTVGGTMSIVGVTRTDGTLDGMTVILR